MHGFIAINKHLGVSSAHTTYKVRETLGVKSAGHTGTLDPLVSGVLVVGFGASTRFCAYLSETKRYQVDCQLGIVTSTWDCEGDIISREHIPGDYSDRVPATLAGLTGLIQQRAPVYSALKHKGKPLYHYARAGIKVPDKVRTVAIHSIEVLNDDHQGKLKLEVVCGKGTYMRSLVADFGEKIGCGATMTGLVRSECSGLHLDECVSSKADKKELLAAIRSPDELLKHHAQVQLSASCEQRLKHGQQVAYESPAGLVRLYDRKRAFFGLGTSDGKQLSAKRLLPSVVDTEQESE